MDKNKLRVIHLNIRSFSKNYDEFSVFLSQIEIEWDVIILTETWFSEDHTMDIPRYSGHHSFRLGRRGGGVSIFVKCELNCYADSDLCFVDEFLELVTVTLILGSVKFVIMGAYRPPNGDVSKLFHFMDNSGLPARATSEKNLILIGDLNLNLLDESTNVLDFINVCRSH